MFSAEIKDYSIALRVLDALRGEADAELTVRVRRILETLITMAEEELDKCKPVAKPDLIDDIHF